LAFLYIERCISSSAWIEESNIKPYQQYKDTLVKSSKSVAFKDAVEAIEDYIAKGEVFEDGLDPDSLFDRLKEDTLSPEKKMVSKIPKPRKETPKAKRLDSSGSDTRRPAKKQRRESSTSNSNRVGSISPALNHSTPTRKSGSTLLNRPAIITRPVSFIKLFLIERNFHLFQSVIDTIILHYI
ncbi:PREDICTED: putative oxidoreductase GLYR1 homolog, partial [Polistes canadensis]|uniref:putative oxidoreductase GLYR1 homolog n=1 Tax=Polistes canadensis TaxID=91411 RepID=UPI000718B94C